MNSTISQKRLAANRANAQKSTGPRTQAGKLRSSMNALKHGLRSPQPISLPSDDPSFLDTFHQSLFEELDPQTPLQLFHFEQLFNAACTIRRVQQLIGLSLYACTLSNEELKKRGIPSLPPAILDRYHRAAQTLFNRTLKALQSPPEPPTAGLPTASAAGANEPGEAVLKATSPVPTQTPIAQLLSAGAKATETTPTQAPIAQLPTAGVPSAGVAGANEPNEATTPAPTTTSVEERCAPNEANEAGVKATLYAPTQSPIAQLPSAGAAGGAGENGCYDKNVRLKSGMSKKVLLVGHCSPDSSYLKVSLKKADTDVEVIRVNNQQALEEHLAQNDNALLLLNRVLDGRFTLPTGVENIIEIRKSHPDLPMMLVSNHADAQQAAEQASALPGFGKRDVTSDRTVKLLRDALAAQPASTR